MDDVAITQHVVAMYGADGVIELWSLYYDTTSLV